MPFYEYQCRACGHELEVLAKVSDPVLKKCPACGKSQLKKLVSAPVFRLKGGGWYETDFKSDKDNKRNLVDVEKTEAKPEPKPESKVVDAKPDAKPEAKLAPKVTDAKPAPKPVKETASRTASKSGPRKAPAKRKAQR